MAISRDIKAVFLDRDGVINELVYHHEQEIIDSPFSPEQFRLLPGVGEAIKTLQEMNYKVILVSNQPSLAKGIIPEDVFIAIRSKMANELAKSGVSLDGEYYCFHHPEGKIDKYTTVCECRKPKPGMLLQAAEDMGLDMSRAWMIGDNLSDVKAGKNAGTKTILLGRMKCELCRLMDENDTRPDTIVPDLTQAVQFILDNSAD
jgi:D-glycero-D-manno-heptose 1,7-bisphosphate phosphatase